jgi:hypothetical protein
MPRYNGGNVKVPMIEKIIKDTLGVDADFEPQFDRLKIPADERVQSRIDKNNAPAHMVNRYANQMGEFDFPPVVLTKDGIKIDGNTRVAAHTKRGDRYIPALVIPVVWSEADATTRRKLLLISEMINNMNGLPLDDTERKKMARTMIEDGRADEDIVGKVGLNLNVVRELREKHKGRLRLSSLGVNADAGHIVNVLRAFGKPTAQDLDDTTFTKLAELTSDAGLKSNEIGALATALAQQGSAELRSERLARERQARADQITALRTGQVVPKLAASLRKKLAALFEHPLTAFIEHDPELVQEHVDLLEKAEEILRNIRVAQGNVQATAAQAQPRATQ